MNNDTASAALSTSDIAAAERVLGVGYSEDERIQMLEAVALQIGRAQALRGAAIDNSVHTASRFDPRLPGFSTPQRHGVRLAQTAPVLPNSDTDIAFAPLTALSHWIRTFQISAQRLTEIYLERIHRFGPTLECIALATPERALNQARAADARLAAGTWLGPLHGIPYGLKDLLDTKGLPTTWGAEPYLDRVAPEDAAIVRRLEAAGAVLVAKTSLGALAYGDIWHGGRTRNPWNIEEGSSGSSAGSGSGTAAGLFGFSIGTETLGSIVSPATRCGATGLRPTFGRVSRVGAMALCWSLDKIGPICRSVADTALVLEVLNGFDANDPSSIAAGFAWDGTHTRGAMRVGYFPAEMEAGLDQAALEAVRGLGHHLVELDRAALPYEAMLDILSAEAAAAFEELTLSNRDDLLTWQENFSWPSTFRRARFLSAVDHVQRDRLRRVVMIEVDRWFTQVDVIIGAPLVGPMGLITNFTGHPCLALRSGFQRLGTRQPRGLGVPVGIADGPTHLVPHSTWLWGRLFDEASILSLGTALEAAFAVADQRPEGFA